MKILRALLLLAAAAVLSASAGPASAAIVINEVMYNSIESTDVEYVEIYNTGPSSQNLAGWYLIDSDSAHPKCFLVGTLAVGAYLVIPGFTSTFQAKYPGVTNLNANQFDNATAGLGFSFGNGGDSVRVFNNIGVLIDFVAYDDLPPWPTAANGTGPSLELINPSFDNTLATSWGASTTPPPNGTPGAVNSVFTPDQAPIIDFVARNVPLPVATDTVTVTGHVTDDHAVGSVLLWVDKGSGYVSQQMFDDGLHGDNQAGDKFYGAQITPAADTTLVKYYIAATDNLPQTATFPGNAPATYLAYTVGYKTPNLVINEILASNFTINTDEQGQFEDWVEIRNRDTVPIDLAGMYLSNNPDQPQVWQFPSTVIQPDGYLLLWCDNDVSQGPLHVNFKLTASEDSVVLFDTVNHGNTSIHATTFGAQKTDVSFGYFPDDGEAPEYLATPTPGATNNTTTLFSSIVINEFQTTSAAGGLDDWVELYNRGPVTVNIGGWHLTDERDQPLKYTFPANTMIASGAFRSVDELALGFSFSSTGSEIILLTGTDSTVGQDFFDYGEQTADITQGRYRDGKSSWEFFAVTSRNGANVCAGGAVPGPVQNLRIDGTKKVISWNALAGATAYDVAQGSLSLLRSSGGDFSVAIAACDDNNQRNPRTYDAETPAVGAGIFYVVRGVDPACGFGTYDSGAASQIGSRDLEIGASATSCP